jgi:colanic acid/amylovoran biosynthesis glycosyltransferase
MHVCHIKVGDFLAPSETFIYRRVTDPQVRHTIVAARWINREKYPLDGTTTLQWYGETAPLIRWLDERLENRSGRSFVVNHFIRSCQPDVVHAHYGAGGWAALSVCEREHIPLIVTLYGSDFHTVYRTDPLWRKRTNLLFQRASFITSISDFMLAQLLQAGCPENKLVKIRCGIDLTELTFTPKLLASDEPLRLLSVARLHPVKRIDTLLRACRILLEKKKSFELRIIGDGPLRNDLQGLARDLGLGVQVKFLLDTPRHETLEHLHWAHVLILCSEMESQGIVLQEAQATGAAVIGTNTGAIPESLADGETGFLVPVGEPSTLAASIERFIDTPSLIVEMGKRGRRFVEERFDVTVERSLLRELYNRAIADRNG